MFSIGSLVVLKSNPEIKMTVCAEANKANSRVTCTYINKNQKIEKQDFPAECLDLFEEKLKDIELQKIPLLYCKSKDCYSFFEYASLFGASIHVKDNGQEENESTRFVFGYKKYYPKHKQEVYNMAIMAQYYLQCEQIVCIPGHTNEFNSLQKTFGVTIERIKEVEPRKNNHKKDLPKDYENSYKIDYTKLLNNILLIDDVFTSGATMYHFKELLMSKGYNVKCLSLGIDHKLDIETVNHFWLFKY